MRNMKNMTFLTVSTLLISLAVHAKGPDNDAKGQTIGAIGFGCAECLERVNGSKMVPPGEKRKSWDELLPDVQVTPPEEGQPVKGSH
jgi:hypothetical protein